MPKNNARCAIRQCSKKPTTYVKIYPCRADKITLNYATPLSVILELDPRIQTLFVPKNLDSCFRRNNKNHILILDIVVISPGFIALNGHSTKLKQWLWQIIEAIPIPLFTFCRLQYLRFSVFPIRNQTDMNIMFRSVCHDICQELKSDIANFYSTFFLYLSPCAIGK